MPFKFLSRKQKKRITFIALFSIVAIIIFGFLDYKKNYRSKLNLIDERLKAAAAAVQFIVRDVHSYSIHAQTVAIEKDFQDAYSLFKLVENIHIDYAYTVIKVDGDILFSSSSPTPQEVQGQVYEPVFWTRYENAPEELLASFENEKITYSEYSDQWGNFRSIFLPAYADDGYLYVVGVDANMKVVETAKQQAVLHTLCNLLLIVALVILWVLNTSRLNKKHQSRFELYQQALSAVAVDVWKLDVQNNVRKYSGELFNSLGYHYKDLPHSLSEWVDFIHPDDWEECRKKTAIAEAATNSEDSFLDMQFRLLSKTGESVWVRSQGRTIAWDKKGRCKRRIGTLANINTIMTAQLKLESKEQQYRSLVNNIPGTTFRCVLDSQRTMLFVSDEVENLTGYPAKDFIGKNPKRRFIHLVHADEINNFWANFRDIVEHKKTTYFSECRIVTRDNETRYIYTKGQPVYNKEGKMEFLDGTIFDVTEKYNYQMQLAKAKEEAEMANRAKSVFLANMSHEIRTPLNAIIGYSQLLIAEQGLNKRARGYTERTLAAGRRLLELISDILDLSKIESGKLSIDQAPFDLSVELADVLAIIESQVNDKGLWLKVSSPLPESYIVAGDRKKVGQILLNLLNNAAKFTHAGGIDFTVELSNEAPVSDIVTFTIKDTGPGIAADELDQLFGLFAQGKEGQASGGTGLGLLLSRQFAEAMGGSLEVNSLVGQGTNVVVKVPLPVTLKRGAEFPQVLQYDKKYIVEEDRHILVVEDDEDSREVLVNILSNMKLKVTAVTDGVEALAACDQHSFDVVMTDIRMPNMNGVILREKLQENSHTLAIPVIAVSASSLEQDKIDFLNKGFDDYIAKPIALANIYSSLSQFMHISVVEHDTVNNVATENDLSAPPLQKVLDTDEYLEALLSAASIGDIALVNSLFESLKLEDVGAKKYKTLEQAISGYDFALLEELLRALVEKDGASST